MAKKKKYFDIQIFCQPKLSIYYLQITYVEFIYSLLIYNNTFLEAVYYFFVFIISCLFFFHKMYKNGSLYMKIWYICLYILELESPTRWSYFWVFGKKIYSPFLIHAQALTKNQTFYYRLHGTW